MRELASEVLVIGAGPAGLAAAVAAAEDGARVLVLDENPAPGGQIWRSGARSTPPAAARELLARARASGVRFLHGTTVFAAESARRLCAIDAGGETLALSAPRLVLATGAVERFLPFPGWTLPGVLGAGGLQALVKGGLDVRGRRVLVAGSGPLLLAVAAHLRGCGARVLGLHEQASAVAVRDFARGLWRWPRKLAQGAALRARLAGIPIRHDSWPVRAFGGERLEAVELEHAGRRERVACDTLACGFGLVPATQLAALLGCAIEASAVRVDALLETSVAGVWAAGEALGIGGVTTALVEGALAGHAAAGAPERARALLSRRRRERAFAAALERAYALRPELRALPDDGTIVCRCEDVAFAALREERDARHAKLQTRAGMGPCQARVCGPALAFLCDHHGDRVRPPLVPVPVDALIRAGSPSSAITPTRPAEALP